MDKKLCKDQKRFMYVFLYLVLTDLSVNASKTCPSMCTCKMLMSKIAVNCEKKDLFEFPKNISRRTEILRFLGNYITTLPNEFYKKWPNTSTLSIEMNRLSFIKDEAFMNLKHLQEVFLYGNRIKSIGKRLFAGSAPGSYITFQLENNLIEEISDNVFEDSSSNFNLNWDSNRIKKLSKGVFKGAEGIQYLNLEHNKLEILGADIFKDLTKLYYLGLANNNISKIDSGAFHGLHRVETLTLGRNKLFNLPSNVFKDLTVVKDISLEANLFLHLPVDAIRSLPAFVKVKLKSNPIICTCQLKNILAEATLKRKIVDLHEIICSNVNMTIQDFIAFGNCDITAATPSPRSNTVENSKSNGNIYISNHTYSTSMSRLHSESTLEASTRTSRVITRMNGQKGGAILFEEYDKQPHLPLIIGATTGALIIIVVIILFVYLYRRPIAARATTTLSLTRKKKNTKSTAYVYHCPKNDYNVDYNI